MASARSFILPACFALAGIAAQWAGVARAADTFKWVDPQGTVQYTDRLPAEAVPRGNVTLSKQGVAKGATDAALTSEQRRVMEERTARDQENLKFERQRQQQENALLSSYTSEEDIEIARKRNLALIGASILSAESRIKSLQRRAQAIEREKPFYEKKPFPERLKRELVQIEQEIPRQYTIIAQKNEDALAINQHYDEQRAQFTDIKNKLAQQTAARR